MGEEEKKNRKEEKKKEEKIENAVSDTEIITEENGGDFFE